MIRMLDIDPHHVRMPGLRECGFQPVGLVWEDLLVLQAVQDQHRHFGWNIRRERYGVALVNLVEEIHVDG